MLTVADPGRLIALPGLKWKRAQEWRDAARELVAQGDLPNEELPELCNEPPRALRPSSVDPYRLRRAMDLRVTVLDDTSWHVTGGLEPHIVGTPLRRLPVRLPGLRQGACLQNTYSPSACCGTRNSCRSMPPC